MHSRKSLQCGIRPHRSPNEGSLFPAFTLDRERAALIDGHQLEGAGVGQATTKSIVLGGEWGQAVVSTPTLCHLVRPSKSTHGRLRGACPRFTLILRPGRRVPSGATPRCRPYHAHPTRNPLLCASARAGYRIRPGLLRGIRESYARGGYLCIPNHALALLLDALTHRRRAPTRRSDAPLPPSPPRPSPSAKQVLPRRCLEV
ncbi:hypothetical protein P153DRAFT_387398 [Dothidotthia symphoricarpi CBS 119687]|uniref:Uncharacterized protein n=1 Tax=Dothidotthia symphoricarpi CBS 119687 TaxID=1392245 RepID=A0A6A6AAE9_9PLEO|nr:uncharacterized protein P153DRAFT_387398 [Dothidotthia symphoricarpi CBS 119687]KAF2127661.1 hypothetical protein P153DRAFT_387398 [Dothidotthia symphoricarpi CBS 119687]